MTLPEDFIRETRLLMGEARFNRFLGAFDEEAPVSIRLNPRKVESGKWKENTPTAELDAEMVAETSSALSSESASESASKHISFLFPPSSFLEKNISRQRVPWCPEGFYLSGRPQFTFDPLFHAGCYYVQEAASMFITHVLRSVTEGRFFCDIASDVTKEPSLCYT